MKHRHRAFYFLLGFLLVALLLPYVSFAGTNSTSGVTAQVIIDRVRYDLSESTADYWSDTELLQWIDEAVQEVVYQTRCLEIGVSTQVLSSQTRSYSLSSLSFLDIEKVEYDSGDTTSPVQVYDLDRVPFINLRLGKEKERGSPKTFAVWNNTLYIWPIPTDTESGTTCYVYYVPVPSGVTTAESLIETPSYFDSAILDYVKGKALSKDLQQDRASFYLTNFYNRIKTYLVNVLRRNVFSLPQTPTQ